MPLGEGEQLGHYKILALIGAGGMGEVYRARDTLLKRDVALKVLLPAFARDPERYARFQREAEVLASLNHPNIATLYGLADGALVMEFVEGESLPCPVPVETAIQYAKQIAEALEYAHERGVIHRDLKPANIKVTPDGVVKLLDFGLAKALDNTSAASSSSDAANSPTLTLGHTVAGQILGTAAYMAPEQVEGRAADRRADIWSFGAVLFEMLAGRRAFEGSTAVETTASAMKSDPAWAGLPQETPAHIVSLIRRCLTKDRRQRLQAIGEARIVLENPGRPAKDRPQADSLPHTRVPWVVAGVFALAAASVSTVHFREAAPDVPVVRTAILAPGKSAFTSGANGGPMALAPDGKRIVFSATGEDGKSQLWVRPLDATAAQPVQGSEGASFPFWAPDSRYLAFFAGGKLKKIDTAGGPPVTLADAYNPRGGAWGGSGMIVFAPNNNVGGLIKISSAGGAVTPVTTPNTGGGNDRAPWFLPDGRHFLFTSLRPPNRVELLMASLDSSDVKTIADTGSNAVYSEGRLLFLRESTLMAQPFDLTKLATSGEAVPIAEGIQRSFSPNTIGMFSASATGLLVYSKGVDDYGLQLTWFDRTGKSLGTIGEPRSFSHIALSPDGKNLVASFYDAQGQDLWIYDLARDLPAHFTFDPAREDFPLWSPDGRSIVFNSVRKGHWDLYRKSADGSGVEELLYTDDHEKYPNTWSPDGKFLLFQTLDGKTDSWTLPLTPESPGTARKPVEFLPAGSGARWAKFSPDGRWVAYYSEESTRGEIYVAPFSGAGGKRQVSSSGGSKPRWRRDGKEIFYLSPDGRLMATEVRISGDTVEVGATHALFGGIPLGNGYGYDISADGQRIIATVAKEQKSTEPITLVQNWAAGLKK